MKKANVLVLGLAILLAFGCGSDEKKDDPMPNSPVVSGPANNKCLLTKGLNKENIYDNSKKLIRQNDLFRNTYSLYEYDATGLVITAKEYRKADSVQIGYSTYEYNTNGFLTKRLSYAPSPSSPTMVLIGTLVQDFNTSNQMIKRTYSGSINRYRNYTYLPNGEIKEEMYNYQNNNPVLYLTSYWTFDNKKSPVTFSFERSGFNNGNVLINTDIDANNDTTVYTHSYVYNTEGYPVEETTVVTGGSTYTYTNLFEYNCQ